MKINSPLWLAAVLSLIVVGRVAPAFGNPGDLDPTFAGTGQLRFGFGFGEDQANAVAAQADRKLLLAGFSTEVNTPEFSIVRLTTNNVLDSTFGAGGIVRTPMSIPGLPSSQAGINSLGIQSDGNIVAAGFANNNSNYTSFALVRYLANGALDTTFGTNGTGKVFTDFGQSTAIQAIAFQPDGKIVAAGFVVYASGNAGENAVVMARYLTNGVLDSTFGTGGTLTTGGATGFTGARAVLIQPDGTIAAAGIGVGSGHNGADFAIYHYTTNGALDPAFGGGTGKVFTQITTNGNNAYYDYANAIVYQSANSFAHTTAKLFVAGSYVNGINGYSAVALARYNLDGSLDTTFGSSGIVIAQLPDFSISSGAVSCFISPGNFNVAKYVIAGSYSDSGADYFAVARFLNGGGLDTAYGTNGNGVDLIPFAPHFYPMVTAAVNQAGQIALAGYQYTANSYYDFTAARFNSDGSIDTNFGTNGELSIDIADIEAEAHAVAVQSDGKIVIGGNAYNGSYDIFALSRVNSDGSFDSSFGSNGKTTTVVGTNYSEIAALQIQPDGKILAAGACNANRSFALARYLANGGLDTTFGSGGVTVSALGDVANAMALQSDGKIILAGGGSSHHYTVARYTTNGAPDTSFNGSGSINTTIGGADYASAVRVQPDGKIVVSGSTDSGISVVRYNTNGSLDLNFGTFGKVTNGIGGGNTLYAQAMALQPDGRILVGGYAVISLGGAEYFALVRFNTNGTPDAGFGTAGQVLTQVEFDYANANAIALQPNGKIFLAGLTQIGAYEQFAVVRYNQDGSLDNNFGSGGIAAFSFNDSSDDYASGAALDQQNRFVLAGFAADLFGVARIITSPSLKISLASPNTAQVSWPGSSTGWTLQQNSNLSGGSWITSGFTVTNNSGTNSFIAPATGNDLFFRLSSP